MVEASERYAAEARRLVPTQVCAGVSTVVGIQQDCWIDTVLGVRHEQLSKEARDRRSMQHKRTAASRWHADLHAQDSEEVAEAFAQTHRKLEALLDARQ